MCPAFETLEGRCVPATGWAPDTAASFNYGVAVDQSHDAVYFAGTAVAKYTTSGSVQWSRPLSNTTNPSAALDPSGAALYVAGTFNGTMAIGNLTLSTASGVQDADYDAFVAKFDANGNAIWAKRFGSSGSDGALAIAADANGIYVTGGFTGDVAFGTQTLSSTGRDAYLTRLDTDGNVIDARQMNGVNAQGRALAVDGAGQIYLSYVTSGNSVVAKIDAAGNAVWTSPIAGAINGEALDGSGRLYVTGNFGGVIRLDTDTGDILWSKQIDGATGVRVAIDSAGNAYASGIVFGGGAIDFDPGTGSAILSSTTGSYGFVVAFNPDGDFQNAWQVAGGGALGIGIDSAANIYLGGNFYTTPVKVDTGTQTVTLSQGPGFVAQIARTKSDIFGHAFKDLNRNGVQDVGETPFAGVTVYLDTNNNGVRNNGEPTATTNAQGGFNFSYLTPGTYQVRVVLPSGHTATTAALYTVTVGAGLADSNSIFGLGRTPKTTVYSNSTTVTTTTSNPNATSTIAIADSYFVQSLSVTLNVTNNANKPLTIRLIGSDGTIVTLAANVKVKGTLTYSTTAFNGLNVNGTWTLQVDGLAGGKLNSWSMSIFG